MDILCILSIVHHSHFDRDVLLLSLEIDNIIEEMLTMAVNITNELLQTISIPSLGYAQFIEFFVRKAAHFLAYFFIGYQWTRGLSVHVRKKGWPQFLAFFIAVLYAMTDEFHQGVTPGRTPLIQDVFVDAVGAAVGVGLGTLRKIR